MSARLINPYAFGALPTLSYRATLESTSGLTTYTFSGADIGALGISRRIVVAVGQANSSSNARTVSTLTVGGVSATFLVRIQGSSGADRMTTELWIADVPTGTTGDIVVTWSGSCLNCKIGIWATYSLNSATPVATNSHAAASCVVSLNTQKDGIVIAAFGAKTLSDNLFVSDQVGVTENYDDGVDLLYGQSGNSASALASDETPRTVTATIGGISSQGGVAVSLR